MSAALPLPVAVERLAAHVAAGHPALGRSLDFARDLCAKAGRGLSAKQAAWVYTLLDRCERPATQPEDLGDVSAIVRLFERARAAGLKFPKIRLAAGDGARVVLSMAGERSRAPGSLNVSDGGGFASGTFYGRITQAGAFTPRDACTPAILAVLRELAADPAGRAAIHGHASGQCCFCGRGLDDARSVAVGYGPVCADKFGLPWGEEKAPPVVLTPLAEPA